MPATQGGIRIRRGDIFALAYAGSAAPTDVQGELEAVDDLGVDRSLHIPPQTSFTTDRTLNFVFGDRSDFNGWLTAAWLDSTSSLKRGQFYAIIYISRSGRIHKLASNYLYAGHDAISLGEFVESGPAGGRGFLSWVAAFAGNRAGNAASVEVSLAATNTFRRVYGIAWYYVCDATVATRTLFRPTINNPGLAKPTGFTATGDNGLFDTLGAGALTLTASEQGSQIAIGHDRDGRKVSIDNGTMTIASTATDPNGLPLDIEENDLVIIRFGGITNGVVGDLHSAYILIEEWLMI